MGNIEFKSYGEYVGRLMLEPLPDGRHMRLGEPYGFVDPDKKKWPVPKGTYVDGATIPRALWSIAGGPYEGNYLHASVIHDYYCDVRSEPWREVHRVFYNGMRASGVSELRAKLMYAAVYFAGPRWSDTAVHNVGLSRGATDAPRADTTFEKAVSEIIEVGGESASEVFRSRGSSRSRGGETNFALPRSIEPVRLRAEETTLDLTRLERLLQTADPDLADIDSAIDSAVRILEVSSSTPNKRIILAQPLS